MNKHYNDLIAIMANHEKRAKSLAHKFARDTYDFNEVGEKILIDHPAAVGALERAYYKLYNSVLSCVRITLTAKEARAFPRNYDVNADTVCVLAAVHCEDGCYGYTIGKCDVDFLDEEGRELEASKMAIDLAFELAANDQAH
jgi:hypothetical protein